MNDVLATVLTFRNRIIATSGSLLTDAADIIDAPSALLLLLINGIFLIHRSLVLPQLSEQNKMPVRAVALLKQRFGVPPEQELS